MRLNNTSILILLTMLVGLLQASQVDQIIEINDAAESWVSKDGRPLYYTSSNSQYMIDNQAIRRMTAYDPATVPSLSPNGEYRLFSLLQDLGEIKNNTRYSDYFVLNDHSELLYAVNRGSESDLKPLVAAVSDNGVLALVDPVKALIYFYESGNLISEGQLYEDDGEMSMERNVLMQWVGDQCYILLERPGFNGGPAGKSLFIRINSNGRGQITAYLPFTYLQKLVFQNQRFFVSGYDYSATDKEMKPMVAELTRDGKMLWNNENFGHELKLSTNGRYLAVLSSHEYIQLFDLNFKRVEKIRFDNNNRVCLGLSVNNRGEVAIIRVAADFFAKRNTHFSQIFFPQSKDNTDVQIDPRFPKLFQIQNDGDRFFIGTSYEWLEISQ